LRTNHLEKSPLRGGKVAPTVACVARAQALHEPLEPMSGFANHVEMSGLHLGQRACGGLSNFLEQGRTSFEDPKVAVKAEDLEAGANVEQPDCGSVILEYRGVVRLEDGFFDARVVPLAGGLACRQNRFVEEQPIVEQPQFCGDPCKKFFRRNSI
jgi:hypothetical protein